MKTPFDAYQRVQRFSQPSLKKHLSMLEGTLKGANRTDCDALLSVECIDLDVLHSAWDLKRAVSQINEVIHAVGILLSLPHILQENETVEILSLGAGNTGKRFDLETTLRIAEFKFTDWKGGSESIRQNILFKDFYSLAEFPTAKRRYLYVIDEKHSLNFFKGRRALKSVMSHENKLWTEFQERYGTRFSTVHEYYEYQNPHVELVDLAKIVPHFDQKNDLNSKNSDE